MRTAFASTLAVLVLLPAAGAGQEAAPVKLVPHRAVYDLSLVQSGGSRSLDSANGRIAFDFGGDACAGYTLKYRQVTVLDSAESGSKTLDVRSATFESADGKTIRFKTDSSMEGASSDNVDGSADVRDGTLAIRLTGPKRETISVPAQPVFPTEHMKRLIEAARSGQHTFAVKVFDGSDNGKKVYDTLALIGYRIEPGQGANLEPAAAGNADLAKLARWPMTISYYAAGVEDRTPVYAISFELYENGVSRALKLDYGDFALKGELASLEVMPYSECRR
jgi:hypothetical protein